MAKISDEIRNGRIDALRRLQQISSDNFVEDNSGRNIGDMIWWKRFNNLGETNAIAA